MKHNRFFAFLLCLALLIGLAAPAFAAQSQNITVSPINVMVGGKVFLPIDPNGKDVPVFVYNGTTYAPLRALAEAYGLTVGYNAEKNLATVEGAPSGAFAGSKGTKQALTQRTTIRVSPINIEVGGEAVYYVYARMTSAEPCEVEALVAVDMSGGSSGSFGNATRLSVGDSFTLHYSGEEFGAHYHVYEWQVTDGEGNVRIEGTGSKCRVEALGKGVATVRVTYEYGVDEPDVLTGNMGPVNKVKTESYNFIIE